jgi:PhnB protein
MSNAKPVPENFPVITPRLFCRNPAAEAAFCVQTLGAKVVNERAGPDGRLLHALVSIGPAMVMIESEWPGFPNRPPNADGSTPVAMLVYVEDVDDAFARGLGAGATVLMPLADQFWGDRTAWLIDPEGHVWTIASRVEETTEEQRKERLSAMFKKSAQL